MYENPELYRWVSLRPHHSKRAPLGSKSLTDHAVLAHGMTRGQYLDCQKCKTNSSECQEFHRYDLSDLYRINICWLFSQPTSPTYISLRQYLLIQVKFGICALTLMVGQYPLRVVHRFPVRVRDASLHCRVLARSVAIRAVPNRVSK